MALAIKEDTNLNLLTLSPKINDCQYIKAYKRRWIILTVFIVYAAISSYQWVEYSIIGNVITRYYNVSPVSVHWTSMIYMAVYAPLVIPASYILDKKGLRVAGLLGCLGTAIGTGIKVFSTDHDAFWVVLLGQGIVAAAQVLIVCLPPRIAAVWFPPKEVSTACALGIFGSQLGCGLGFLLPPILVKNHENVNDIQFDLKVMCWSLTALAIPAAVAVPPKPPSNTQLDQRNNKEYLSLKLFYESICTLLKNIPFLIHVVAYGINMAVFSAFGTLLNQLILLYFQDQENVEEFAGRIGLIMVIAGIFAVITFGIYLDKTHKYKETTLFTYFFAILSLVAFMFALEMKSNLLVYIAGGIVGFAGNAYIPVGFEFAMELTYPSSESTTTGLLMAPSQILGTFFVLLIGKLNIKIGPFWSMATQIFLLLAGALLTLYVPNNLKRQAAFKNGVVTRDAIAMSNN